MSVAAWSALHDLSQNAPSLVDLFASDPGRAQAHTHQYGGYSVDVSKQRIEGSVWGRVACAGHERRSRGET